MATELPRVHTGIEGLDDLLYGGVLEGDTMLLAGAPGSGKTSLGMQFLYHGATRFGDPGVLITFEEFPQRIYRDAGNFGWDFPRLEEENKLKVIFTSPDLIQQDVLNEQGIIVEMLREMGARRAVVDSISHLQHHPSLHGSRREAIYGLMNALKRENLTSLLIRELPREEEIGLAPEDFVTDGLIVLSQERIGGHRMRFVEVLKSRGTPHIPMRGMLSIGPSGLSVFSSSRRAFYQIEEAAATGISDLDDLLGGGIPYGGFYLLENSSSFHYQLLEVNFIKEALETGDICVHIGSTASLRQEVSNKLEGMGISESLLEDSLRKGAIRVIGPVTSSGEGINTEQVINALEEIHKQIRANQKVRILIDLSSLAVSVGLDEMLLLLSKVQDNLLRHKSVCLGLLSPTLVGEAALSKVRAIADGILCIWNQGDFDYLQILKTVNSVRTRIQPIREIPEPPYLKILS